MITPQRFGDVFLYSNGRFPPPFDDDFGSTARAYGIGGGSSAFGLGDAFSSLSLIHGQWPLGVCFPFAFVVLYRIRFAS